MKLNKPPMALDLIYAVLPWQIVSRKPLKVIIPKTFFPNANP
jgi:hypothetical protein